MKNLIVLLSVLASSFCNAQKLYKDKTATLAAITEKGYRYTEQYNNANVYWYKRYDSYGETTVKLTFEGNLLRKAVYGHLDPTQTLNRLRDIYAKTTNQEADTFDPPSNGYGKGEASNTPYYLGKARYECNNNYATKDFLFTIVILE
jgi:hypothetical protein